VAAVHVVLVALYFLLASAVARTNFFGVETTPHQAHQSSLLSACAASVLLAGTPIAVVLVYACVRCAERKRSSLAATCAWLIVAGGPVAFVVALLVTPLFPTDFRPFAFGFLWLVGAVIVAPMGSALLSRATDRGAEPTAAAVHHPR
jgi:hypothetical protein